VSKRAFLALLFSLMLTATGLAQSIPGEQPDGSTTSSSEFCRATGGELSLIAKQRNGLSGSVGMTLSRSLFPSSGSGNANRYQANIGGTAVQDHLWFFATAERSVAPWAPAYTPLVAQSGRTAAASRTLDTRLNAQIGSRQSLAAAFAAGVQRTATPWLATPNPSSFLSLHYTGMVSSNMVFTTNISRSATQSQQGLAALP
jgi:hypothetical protein